jgi:hypothetical protein
MNDTFVFQPRKPIRYKPRPAAQAAPPPPPPPPPANVVLAVAMGETCTLQFDQPIVLSGAPVDDAMLFGGEPATGVSQADAYTLLFTTPQYVSNTSPWYVQRQPDWVATVVQVGQSGIFS